MTGFLSKPPYVMINEKVIEGLREYLKDHNIPPHGLADSLSVIPLSSISHICGNSIARIATPFRSISDETADYKKNNRKP
jgi:hypothetical protein